jgi:hypothetical protein
MCARRQFQDVATIDVGVHHLRGADHFDGYSGQRDGVGLIANNADDTNCLTGANCRGRLGAGGMRGHTGRDQYDGEHTTRKTDR